MDGTVPGLALRVHPSGRKTWSLRYRVGRHERRWTLGVYPVVGLAAARKKARRALTQLDEDGTDPGAAKRDARTRETLGELATEYLEAAKRKKRSWSQDDQVLRTVILPLWKHRAVKDITRSDVRALLALVERGKRKHPDGTNKPAPVRANRVAALISAMFNYALQEEWIATTPAVRIPKFIIEKSRERVLDDVEIKQLWEVCEAAKIVRRTNDDGPAPAITPKIAIGLQVILLTAQRPGEVFRMLKADLYPEANPTWWVLAATATKNSQTHRVPLVPRVVELLRAAQALGPSDNKFVFGGIKGGSVADRAVKAMAALRRANAITFDCHRHDLRRTAATNLAAAGVPRTTIMYVLNHVDRGSRATQVYDRFEHDADKREALEIWARRLNTILTVPAPPSPGSTIDAD
jgi:integrase